jgi:type IV secretory pathway VirB2 component (pilin)
MAKRIFQAALLSLALFAFALNSYAALVECGNSPDKQCTWQNLEELVQKVFDFALTYIAIPIAVLMVVWGGIQMAISAGDEGKFKRGRQIITAAAIGLLIVFGAWLIVNTVLKFVGIPTSQ